MIGPEIKLDVKPWDKSQITALARGLRRIQLVQYFRRRRRSMLCHFIKASLLYVAVFLLGGLIVWLRTP